MVSIMSYLTLNRKDSVTWFCNAKCVLFVKMQNTYLITIFFKKKLLVSADKAKKVVWWDKSSLKETATFVKRLLSEGSTHESDAAERKPMRCEASCIYYVAIWFQPSTRFGSTTWHLILTRAPTCWLGHARYYLIGRLLIHMDS